MATKETLRVDAPDTSSLRDLKTLIAGKLSSSSSSPPIDPESIHLSLNRKDELFAPSSPAADPLPSLGLTSGDLLFYSLSPLSQTLVPANPPGSDSFGRVQTLGSKPEDRMEVDADGTAGTLESKPEGRMWVGVDPEPSVVVKKPSLVPRILKRVMDLEKGENEGILGRLLITIHAAFLDSGFLVGRGGDGSPLPRNWASDASNLSVQYTLHDLVDRREERDTKFSIVRCSVMGNFVTIYGYLSVEHPDVYRVCIDASKIAPFLSLAMDSMSERDEKEILKLWNMVKDGVCLPLLIDICAKNRLPLPPCYMRLSRDLKTDILELVSGVDLARIACTCSEMSAICSDDKLWKKKFEKEFGSSSGAGVQVFVAYPPFPLTVFCTETVLS
ncbi:F-box protein SKIP22 [Ananas comosus]|uniref:F-box protein SKIP22 n=1 Tax=Ananas comosus TaxID=4615 RepID=A0A199UFX4_ANACO|nr:F-box protein SKIP22 [Ananas comosus]